MNCEIQFDWRTFNPRWWELRAAAPRGHHDLALGARFVSQQLRDHVTLWLPALSGAS
jgi:hypothetical protein